MSVTADSSSWSQNVECRILSGLHSLWCACYFCREDGVSPGKHTNTHMCITLIDVTYMSHGIHTCHTQMHHSYLSHMHYMPHTHATHVHVLHTLSHTCNTCITHVMQYMSHVSHMHHAHVYHEHTCIAHILASHYVYHTCHTGLGLLSHCKSMPRKTCQSKLCPALSSFGFSWLVQFLREWGWVRVARILMWFGL